ncbi:MAG TPA: geranylgeranylglycerol-phosphate geranylgeranyltransferase [Bacteroidales bacterium]|nr:geranylgeranylglycerol-phosphate geranylgeranyltransferase [Bacteroidales bacterium]
MNLKAVISLVRPINLAIMAGMLLLVRYAIFEPVFAMNHLSGLMPFWQFLLLILATVLIGAGGYVINDVLDIEIDRINKPDRQIIGKKISVETGNKLHFNLTASGIVLGIAFSYLSGNIFLAILFVIIPTALFYYSFKYKYLPIAGNLVVALLAALTVIIYWLFEFYHLKKTPEVFIEAASSFAILNRFILAFASFAFLTTLTREIIKDAEDMTGDSRFGCNTLAIVLGQKKVKYLIIALEVVLILLLAWFQLNLHRSGLVLMSWSLLITQVLIVVTLFRTIKTGSNSAFRQLSLFFKIIMVTGMLSLLTVYFRNI